MAQPRAIALGATCRFKFNTYRFSTGAPFTLAGTPSMSVYEDDNETQITAGLTLTVDYDAITGLHEVEAAATAGNGYEDSKHYTSHIAAGTVDSISVIGVQVYEFEIEPASVEAVRLLRETLAATATLTTQTGVSDNTKVNLTGIVDAQSANDLFNGWYGVLKDETDGQVYLVKITDFTLTNLLASIVAADPGVTLPTPASGDKFWLIGLAPLMPTVPGRTLDVASNGALDTDSITALLTTAMTESYAADGVAPTLAQALFLIQQVLTEFSVSGTTVTVKKLDGSTSAGTLTLSDATTPTSITRAT